MDLSGLANFLVGAGGTAAAPSGAEGSVGLVYNPGWYGHEERLGVFGSVGGTVGVNVSADFFVGYVSGDISNVSGTTINQNFTFGPISWTNIHDPSSMEFIGFTAGFGTGATPVGYSGAYSQTGVMSTSLASEITNIHSGFQGGSPNIKP